MSITDGAALVASWPRHHPYDTRCPECSEDCNRTALVEVAYLFAPCLCDAYSYAHLVQQLWHQRCLRTQQRD